MGTFHDNLGEWHGITVAVETTNHQAWVGRCHEASDVHVLLLDADVHEEGEEGLSNQDWLIRASKWGVFGKHKVMKLDAKEVTSLKKLHDVMTG